VPNFQISVDNHVQLKINRLDFVVEAEQRSECSINKMRKYCSHIALPPAALARQAVQLHIVRCMLVKYNLRNNGYLNVIENAHSVPCHVLRGRYRIIEKKRKLMGSSEAQLFIIVCMRYILH